VKRTIAVALLILVLAGCDTPPQPSEKKIVAEKPAQDLRITLGGFVENHPEGGILKGVCGTDDTRNVLNCDIHNGLLNWTVTEITIGVTWTPYKDDDVAYYKETVSIESLKTGQVSIRLGTQLPPDSFLKFRNRAPVATQQWSWLLANAKGIPSGKE
jgi:hypothetical protein